MTKENTLRLDDRIFIAGASGMAGSSIVRSLRKKGYGNENNNIKLLTPKRQD